MKQRVFWIIAISCFGSIAGCDKSPGAKPAVATSPPPPLPVLPVQEQPAPSSDNRVVTPAPTPAPAVSSAPLVVLNIDNRIDQAKSKIQVDVTALTKAEKGCISRLNANPKYIAAMSAREDAAEKVRQDVRDGIGGDDYSAAVKALNDKMQALVDARRSILDGDTIVLDARKKVADDESELESLLKQKGIQVAAAPTPTQTPSPNIDSSGGASVLFPENWKSGGTYVPGYYQQDGTYVPPHYQQ